MAATWRGSGERDPQGCQHIVDVWQSKDQYEVFTGERLHPVVHPLLQEMVGFVPPEPTRTVLDVIDGWTERYPN
jgi:hypothetical protein